MITEMDKRYSDKFVSIEEQVKKDNEHKLMSISMINIMDERVNAFDTRLVSVEKLTKDIHATVQKYKAKGGYAFEKLITEKFEQLNGDTQKFIEAVKIKLLEIGTSVETKCKKILDARFALMQTEI